MNIAATVQHFVGGNAIIANYIIRFVEVATFAAVATTLFRAWKIQPNGFKWKRLFIELAVAAVSGPITGLLFGFLSKGLNYLHPIEFNPAPVGWWVVTLEYAFYFLAFDTWFYWFHRLMHKEPFYKWIHKVHHWSTSPNPVTTFSVTPLESLINGGFLPIFTTVVTLHQSSMKFISPTAVIMGVYVHLGYEFLPRWWNRTWLTKWFITTTFHDQHHKYFNYNYGGFTTIWDWICGTVRSRYVEDFEKIGAKKATEPMRPAAVVPPSMT